MWIDNFLIAAVLWFFILLSQIFYIGIGLLGWGFFMCTWLSYCFECTRGGYCGERDCVSLNGARADEFDLYRGVKIEWKSNMGYERAKEGFT